MSEKLPAVPKEGTPEEEAWIQARVHEIDDELKRMDAIQWRIDGEKAEKREALGALERESENIKDILRKLEFLSKNRIMSEESGASLKGFLDVLEEKLHRKMPLADRDEDAAREVYEELDSLMSQGVIHGDMTIEGVIAKLKDKQNFLSIAVREQQKKMKGDY